MCNGCTFVSSKLLLVLQRGHVAHLFLCFLGGLGDQEDLGGQVVQQVQPGLGHPDQNQTTTTENKNKSRTIREEI